MINFEIKIILIKNDENRFIRICRNLRLNRFIEMKYSNAYYVQIFFSEIKKIKMKQNDLTKLTRRRFKSKQKKN